MRSRVSIIHKIQGQPMSTQIPSITACKFSTPSKRRFARLLEAKLEDDYLCWYNVSIGPSKLHPDFIYVPTTQKCDFVPVHHYQLKFKIDILETL